MGNFYSNVVLRCTERDQLVDILRSMRRTALVSPTLHRLIFVYDAGAEAGGLDELRELARELSSRLRCVAWVVSNHDDDVLSYILCASGQTMDEYVSAPDYFEDTEEPAGPAGGDAAQLADAFGVPAASGAIESILRKHSLDEDGYVFEIERHQALAALLGVPAELACTGYDDVEQEYDSESAGGTFTRVDGDASGTP